LKKNYYKKSGLFKNKKNLKKYILLFLALFILYLFYGNGENSIIKLLKRKKEIENIKNEIVRIEQQNKKLKQEIKLLEEKDLYYIEKIARERFGMIKEGEKVYKIIRTKKE